MRSPLHASLVLAALALAAPARAEVGLTTALPPGPGQQALGLRVEAGGVRVRACAAAPCAPDGGSVIAPPEGPRLEALATAPGPEMSAVATCSARR